MGHWDTFTCLVLLWGTSDVLLFFFSFDRGLLVFPSHTFCVIGTQHLFTLVTVLVLDILRSRDITIVLKHAVHGY